MTKCERTIWRDVEITDDEGYVHRCSFCGKIKKKLKAHWFFTGLYCMNCILEVLWNDTRSWKEITNEG